MGALRAPWARKRSCIRGHGKIGRGAELAPLLQFRQLGSIGLLDDLQGVTAQRKTEGRLGQRRQLDDGSPRALWIAWLLTVVGALRPCCRTDHGVVLRTTLP